MTNQEFSAEFEVLLDSFSSINHLSIKLDEYEKSVFLTMAQEQFVKELYNGATTTFESTEAVRRSLDSLVKDATLNESESGSFGKIYTIDQDCLYIIYESMIKSNDNKVGQLVVPTSHDEFYKTYNNPFKGPSATRALRLDVGDNQVEIIGGEGDYYYRYLRKPLPIILESLEHTDLYINNRQEQTTCELDEALHRTILINAVNLAISTHVSKTQSK